jgi:hypothetical protein
MEEDDNEMYKTHFARYIDADVSAENMEETWQKVYDSIRKDPAYTKTDKKKHDKPGKVQSKVLPPPSMAGTSIHSQPHSYSSLLVAHQLLVVPPSPSFTTFNIPAAV